MSATLNETSWTESVYDLSAVADNNPEFQIRFGLGPTDGSQVYGGWNIDDISLKGYVSSSGGSSYADFATTSLSDSLVEGEQAVQNVVVRNTGEATLRIRFVPTVTWLECSDDYELCSDRRQSGPSGNFQRRRHESGYVFRDCWDTRRMIRHMHG